jgi:outer membrane cobalamin receptor
MKKGFFFSGIFLLLLAMACGTTQLPADSNSEELTDLLRSIPGISVVGNGDHATIKVRGIIDYSGKGEPLFVLDGIEVAGGFYSLTNRVRANEITSINVLSHRNQTSRYGSAGDNGVIEISTL